MRLKRDRFNRLTGKAAPPPAPAPEPAPEPPMPVAAPSIDVSALERKLEGLEKMMSGVFVSQARMARRALDEPEVAPSAPPDPVLNARLASMEANLRALAKKETGETWLFSVKRDGSGRISTVEATKKAETD